MKIVAFLTFVTTFIATNSYANNSGATYQEVGKYTQDGIEAGETVEKNLTVEEWHQRKLQREKYTQSQIDKATAHFKMSLKGRAIQADDINRPANPNAENPTPTGSFGSAGNQTPTGTSQKGLGDTELEKQALKIHGDKVGNATRAFHYAMGSLKEMRGKEDDRIPEEALIEFVANMNDRRTIEMLAAAESMVQNAFCMKIDKYDALSYWQFKAASAIFLSSCLNYMRDYKTNAKEMEREHLGDNKKKDTVVAAKAGVHNMDENIQFTDKIIKSRQLYSDMANWARLQAQHESNVKHKRIKTATDWVKHHEKWYKIHLSQSTHSPGSASKAIWHKSQIDYWKRKKHEAMVFTHLICGDYRSKDNPQRMIEFARKYNPPLDMKKYKEQIDKAKELQQQNNNSTFFLPGLFFKLILPKAFANNLGDTLWKYFVKLREENSKTLWGTLKTPEGRVYYFENLGMESQRGLDDLRKLQSELWAKRGMLNDLYKKMYKKLKEKEKGMKVEKNAVANSNRKFTDLSVNAQTGCPTCDFNPITVAFGDLQASGLLNSTNGKGKNATANVYRKKDEKTKFELDEFTKALAKNNESLDIEVPYRGNFKGAYGRTKYAFKNNPGLPDGFFSNFLFNRDGSPATASTYNNDDDEDDEVATAPKPKKKETPKAKKEKAKIKTAEASELGEEEKEPEDVEYVFEDVEEVVDIVEDKDVSIWIVISNRYIRTGIRRLSDNPNVPAKNAVTTDGPVPEE